MNKLRFLSQLFFWTMVTIASISSIRAFAAEVSASRSRHVTIDGTNIKQYAHLFSTVYYQLDIPISERGNNDISSLMNVIRKNAYRNLDIRVRNIEKLKLSIGAGKTTDLLTSLQIVQSENPTDITLSITESGKKQ